MEGSFPNSLLFIPGPQEGDSTGGEEMGVVGGVTAGGTLSKDARGLACRGVETPDWGGGLQMGLDVMSYRGGGECGIAWGGDFLWDEDADIRDFAVAWGGDDPGLSVTVYEVICRDWIPESIVSVTEGAVFWDKLELEWEWGGDTLFSTLA